MLSSLTIVLLLLLLIPAEMASASKSSPKNRIEIGKRYQLTLRPEHINTQPTSELIKANSSTIDPASAALQQLEQTLQWHQAIVRHGDSLAKILANLGYSSQTTYQLSVASGNDIAQLRTLNVGDTLRIGSNAEHQLIALVYPISNTESLFIQQTAQGYRSSKIVKTVEARFGYAHGLISSNFWNAGLEAGLNDNQVIELANIFGWDIDFAQDLRQGDSFSIVYEKNYIEGEFIGTGHILAAEFVNQNETYQAIRYNDGEYYTPQGASMRKAFLRAPVNFRYISSNFSKRRFHPVLKRWKAHNGTDYSAKVGTPVVAAGDGKVIRSTYNRFNGNYVFIQHSHNIETKYLHFSKRAVKKGQYVKQGQVIGYVGQTGLASGPHLHYEFLVNGMHRNPRTVKLPDAKPIDKQQLSTFTALAQQRLQQLAGAKVPLLAMRTDDD